MSPRHAASPDCPFMRNLLDMPSGCMLRVEELTGSPSVRSKLYSMGILPGTEMELRGQGCNKGCVCVRVRGCTLVLGESMAKCIFCRAADENEAHIHRGHRHGGPGWCSPFRGRGKQEGKACIQDN